MATRLDPHTLAGLALALCALSAPVAAQFIPAPLVPVVHDPRPKRMYSKQFISYTPPAHWTAKSPGNIWPFLFAGPGAATCTDPYNPACWAQFPAWTFLPYERDRITYETRPAMRGTMSFFLALYYAPLNEFRFTAVQRIDFDRPVLGPRPRPSKYQRTQPFTPTPNLDPSGDLYVDPVLGNDQNSGTIAAPVRTIWHALGLIDQRFPTPQDRAGKHLILRGGDYFASSNPLKTILGFYNYQAGIPGKPFTIRGYPGETVRLRGYNGQMATQYQAISLTGTSYLTLENMMLDNVAYDEGINADNTTGLTLRFIELYARGCRWGLDAWGDLREFKAEGCRFAGTSWQDNVTISAGILGNVATDIVFRSCEFDHASWWGLQFSGVAQDVLIENCHFWENGLGPVAVKNASGVVIRGNTFVGNNRSLNIEHTFDENYWHRGYGPDPLGRGRQDVTNWWSRNFSTLAYIDIVYNTLVMPAQGCMPVTGYPPQLRPGIVLAEKCGSDVNGYPIAEPFNHVRINNNIVVTQSTGIIQAGVSEHTRFSRHERMVEAYELHDNLFYATAGPVEFQHYSASQPTREPLQPMESSRSTWSNNIFDRDPQLIALPPCPQYQSSVIYNWELMSYPGDLHVGPASPAVDRGTAAAYSLGYRSWILLDPTTRPRTTTPDLGALESH